MGVTIRADSSILCLSPAGEEAGDPVPPRHDTDLGCVEYIRSCNFSPLYTTIYYSCTVSSVDDPGQKTLILFSIVNKPLKCKKPKIKSPPGPAEPDVSPVHACPSPVSLATARPPIGPALSGLGYRFFPPAQQAKQQNGTVSEKVAWIASVGIVLFHGRACGDGQGHIPRL
jgi:hypothetical protein